MSLYQQSWIKLGNMLKMTGVKLALITDADMYQFIEKGVREGVSYIAQRYRKTNNKHIESYGQDKSSKYSVYNYPNNMYGWAMSEYLLSG